MGDYGSVFEHSTNGRWCKPIDDFVKNSPLESFHERIISSPKPVKLTIRYHVPECFLCWQCVGACPRHAIDVEYDDLDVREYLLEVGRQAGSVAQGRVVGREVLYVWRGYGLVQAILVESLARDVRPRGGGSPLWGRQFGECADPVLHRKATRQPAILEETPPLAGPTMLFPAGVPGAERQNRWLCVRALGALAGSQRAALEADPGVPLLAMAAVPGDHCPCGTPQARKRNLKPMPSRSYVLVSACRDEAGYIDGLIDAVAAQTVQPFRWVIVDDGSTDGAYERIVARSRTLGFLEPAKMPAGRPRSFSSKVYAVQHGCELVKGPGFLLIGFLDAERPVWASILSEAV